MKQQLIHIDTNGAISYTLVCSESALAEKIAEGYTLYNEENTPENEDQKIAYRENNDGSITGYWVNNN